MAFTVRAHTQHYGCTSASLFTPQANYRLTKDMCEEQLNQNLSNVAYQSLCLLLTVELDSHMLGFAVCDLFTLSAS